MSLSLLALIYELWSTPRICRIKSMPVYISQCLCVLKLSLLLILYHEGCGLHQGHVGQKSIIEYLCLLLVLYHDSLCPCVMPSLVHVSCIYIMFLSFYVQYLL